MAGTDHPDGGFYQAVSPYTMAVRNVAAYIAGPVNQRAVGANDGSAMTAFEASAVLGVAFCKAKEEVIVDILRATTV